jgi:hypothetical protein
VAWFEIMGPDGGYVVVPRGSLRGRAHLLRPAAQPSAPHPGPTLAFEILNRRRVRRIDVTARYAPARDRDDAARVAARLRGRP